MLLCRESAWGAKHDPRQVQYIEKVDIFISQSGIFCRNFDGDRKKLRLGRGITRQRPAFQAR
jgi:hypothetical protein